MTLLFLITALLVIPAGFLIVIGDETNPLEDAKRVVKKNAKQSHDRTGLRLRLEELGRGTDKDYEEFRIKQYGYCASSSALHQEVEELIQRPPRLLQLFQFVE